jgi:hypothetical protein
LEGQYSSTGLQERAVELARINLIKKNSPRRPREGRGKTDLTTDFEIFVEIFDFFSTWAFVKIFWWCF